MTTDHDGNHSNPYRPGPLCCEKCVFGRGEHAAWCEGAYWPHRLQFPPPGLTLATLEAQVAAMEESELKNFLGARL